MYGVWGAVLAILLSFLFLGVGAVQTYRLAVNGLQYASLMEKVNYYTQQFSQWNSTVAALKETDRAIKELNFKGVQIFKQC
jgi:hypothetical protein